MNLDQIPSEYLAQIRKQAEKEYPSECCGVILASVEGVWTRVVPCRNAQDDYHRLDPKGFPRTSRNAYALDPGQLLTLQKENRVSGEVIRVIYHSHPDAPAYFSDEDKLIAAPDGVPAWPGTTYLVVSVLSGKSDKISLIFWDETLKEFKAIF